MLKKNPDSCSSLIQFKFNPQNQNQKIKQVKTKIKKCSHWPVYGLLEFLFLEKLKDQENQLSAQRWHFCPSQVDKLETKIEARAGSSVPPRTISGWNDGVLWKRRGF